MQSYKILIEELREARSDITSNSTIIVDNINQELKACTMCGLELSVSEIDKHDCQFLLNTDHDTSTNTDETDNEIESFEKEHPYSKLNKKEKNKLLEKEVKRCDKCPKVFRKRNTLLSHVNTVHLGVNVRFIIKH